MKGGALQTVCFRSGVAYLSVDSELSARDRNKQQVSETALSCTDFNCLIKQWCNQGWPLIHMPLGLLPVVMESPAGLAYLPDCFPGL